MDIYDFNDMLLVDMDKTKIVANFYGFSGMSAPSTAKKDNLDEIVGLMNGS